MPASPTTTSAGYEARGIQKRYGGVTALHGADLDIRPGEVHGLVGSNGAGKSTLVKILVGAERPSAGTLRLGGQAVDFTSTAEAATAGVAIVSQELSLFGELSVLDNLFLGREPRRGGLLARRAMRAQAAPVCAQLGLDVDVDGPVGHLRLADQQLVEIARALLREPRILFLDEPTSALQAAETERLLGVVRGLRDRGVGVVYVTHFLEDLFAVCDVVTVLRDGRVAQPRLATSDTDIPAVVRAMLGDRVVEMGRRPQRPAPPADASALTLDDVWVRGRLHGVSLTARAGEVVGLAGLEGAGARPIMDVAFGAVRPERGAVQLPRGRGGPASVPHAVRAGVALVPADRKRVGVMLDKSLLENVTTVSAGVLGQAGPLARRGTLRARAERWRDRLAIRSDGVEGPVAALSGGNQQKVVFAKWLDAAAEVYLLDDPTRGVDIGAKAEMHDLIGTLAQDGRVVLVSSSDLDELVGLCDRVIVLFAGRVAGELSAEALTEHRLLEAINTGETGTG